MSTRTIQLITILIIFFIKLSYADTTSKWEETELQDELRFLRAELITVETASGTEESLLDAPATIVIVTAEEIKQRGYTDLSEVITDLPGFDAVIANGTSYMLAYQRGYRTPYTARTLIMFNGIVDNLLWSQEAAITRQYPLSNIKRVEVLYGPASAVYGPNAFLGIINVITHDANDVEVGKTATQINVQVGSYNSKGVDASIKGKPTQDLSFSLTGKVFKSDEADLSNQFGFLETSKFNNPKTWGPLLEIEHENRQLGSYYDPTDDYGILADLQYKGFKLGLIHWKIKEAYGPYYAADRAQNNNFWNKSSDQFSLEYRNKITESLKSHSLLLYRESRRYGYWSEAEQDWNPGMEDHSYISFTHWNSDSNSWLFKQNLEFALHKNLLISGGVKFERKELTKAYDVPGYWEPAISSSTEGGSGIGHSTDATYIPPPPPLAEMPENNLAHTRDIGGYLQAIFDVEPYRFNFGVRYDKNSIYGDVVNPRTSIIYKLSNSLTFKIFYGEAFQEPAPLQLWGGWSGRKANPDLKPEQGQTFEFVTIHQMQRFIQEFSLYQAYYKDVVKEEAENAGERDIHGFEYRAKYSFPNFIPYSSNISSYFNYTYTQVTSSMYYDHELGEWLNGDTYLGDIAAHKFNIGFNVPLGKQWNLNLRGNFVGERELYTRNPLRSQDEKLDSYFILNGVVTYHYKPFDISFKVLNMLDKDYFHPGVEAANSGNDFSQRSKGYMNSILPQPGRSLWLNLGVEF
ncbi:TonB-dependent receptor [Candidatus Halobeggiatoa sp. HSG11]|nr:TonB-dependent receptor [Candidatus Halobeggiatoa sp. HSG11]